MLIAIVPKYTSIGEQKKNSNRGTKKEQYINISESTVGQAQEKLPKEVAQNPRVQDAQKKALEY